MVRELEGEVRRGNEEREEKDKRIVKLEGLLQ